MFPFFVRDMNLIGLIRDDSSPANAFVVSDSKGVKKYVRMH